MAKVRVNKPAPIKIRVADEIPLKEKLKAKFIDPARRSREKVRSEQVVGDDYHISSGTWRKVKRVIDHDNDRYSEEVVDPRSGDIIVSVEHPLSEHRGHGSAKRKGSKPNSGD
jgi:hypothetical protein